MVRQDAATPRPLGTQTVPAGILSVSPLTSAVWRRTQEFWSVYHAVSSLGLALLEIPQPWTCIKCAQVCIRWQAEDLGVNLWCGGCCVFTTMHCVNDSSHARGFFLRQISWNCVITNPNNLMVFYHWTNMFDINEELTAHVDSQYSSSHPNVDKIGWRIDVFRSKLWFSADIQHFCSHLQV